MIQELWQTFPVQLEQKINGLLQLAEPNNIKAFQLYKSCQREEAWQESFEKFTEHIASYFTLPFQQRRKSDLDRLLDRPLDQNLYSLFNLDFGSANIDSSALKEIADWAHHLMRIRLKKESQAISQKTLQQSMHQLTHPQPHEKVFSVTFNDFCNSWKKTIRQILGQQEELEADAIIQELQVLYAQVREAKAPVAGPHFVPTIYLTQTEITWVEDILMAIDNQQPLPAFPLSKGPHKQRLCELNRTAQLYKIVQTTRLPELIEHKEKIQSTLIHQCQRLLSECAR